MIDESRIDIYDYLCGLLKPITSNVYAMDAPQELTTSDTTDGFIVVRLGDVHDESEFDLETYGWVRAFVEAYVPHKSRGRLDRTKYKAFEDDINYAIRSEMKVPTSTKYFLEQETILSMDDLEDTNSDNAYNMFIKSFIVQIQ